VPRYGRIDGDYGRWMAGSVASDPVYMLNLLKYRPEADYGFGGARGISGLEADCLYAPLPALIASGVTMPFLAGVVASQAGWDRVAVLRFPSRQSFIRIMSREDFQERHVHREAGMERLIIMGTVPVAELPPSQAAGRRTLLEVWAGPEPGPVTAGKSVAFDVEGTIVGDGRSWTGARYTVVEPGRPLPLQLPRPDYQALLLEPNVERWEWLS
jgi:hypothetical protein